MAIKGGVRWKPDQYRTSLEATVTDLNPTGQQYDENGNPTTATGVPEGTVVMIAQAVAYDDAVFGDGAGQVPYRPGDPETERHLVVLHEETKMYELSAAYAPTAAQIDAFFAAELEAYRDWVLPAGGTLAKVMYTARMAPPILVED